MSPAVDRDELETRLHCALWLSAALIPLICLFAWIMRFYSLFMMARIAYFYTCNLLPALLALAVTIGAWRHGRNGLQVPLRLWRRYVASLVLAAVLLGTYVYATHIEPRMLFLREAALPNAKRSRPLRLLHISDIQSAGVGAHEERAFAMMRELAPDIILSTGDLLQPLPPYTLKTELPKLSRLIATLDPPLGSWHAAGDTDWRFGEQWPLPTLFSQGAVLKWGDARILLFGLSLVQSRLPKLDELEEWLEANHQPGDFVIVFGHSPQFTLHVGHLPVDLCLAGHTHGGQIHLPGFGALVNLSPGFPLAWSKGFRVLENGQALNVSAGIGAEHAAGLPSIRFNCPPEMTLLTIGG